MACGEERGGPGDIGAGEEGEAAPLSDEGPLKHVQDANATATDRALSVGDEAGLPSIEQCSTSDVDSPESKSPDCDRNPGQDEGFRFELLDRAPSLDGLPRKVREDVKSDPENRLRENILAEDDDYSQNVLTVADYPLPENVLHVDESNPDPNALVEENRNNVYPETASVEDAKFTESDGEELHRAEDAEIDGDHAQRDPDQELVDANMERQKKALEALVHGEQVATSQSGFDFSAPQEEHGDGMHLDLALGQALPATEQGRELEARLLDSDEVANLWSGLEFSAPQEEHGDGKGLNLSLHLGMLARAEVEREVEAPLDGGVVTRSQSGCEFSAPQEEHGDGTGLELSLSQWLKASADVEREPEALPGGDEVARSQSGFEFPAPPEEHGDGKRLELALDQELVRELEALPDGDEVAKSQSASEVSALQEEHGDGDDLDSVPASPKRKRGADRSQDKPAKNRAEDPTNAAEATRPGSGAARAVAVEGSRSDNPSPNRGSPRGLESEARADVQDSAAPSLQPVRAKSKWKRLLSRISGRDRNRGTGAGRDRNRGTGAGSEKQSNMSR